MRIPTSTYRVQFNRGFTFADAIQIIDYLHDLGITDLYSSPIFLAGPQSTHGYDVCGFELNPNLGSPDDFEKLTHKLRSHGMGLLLDIVPNHMGNGASNKAWRDVLKNGPNSQFANFFDIDWHSAAPSLRDKVLLPVLGRHYGDALKRGELKLVISGGQLEIAYFDKTFPLSPQTEEKIREEAKWRRSGEEHDSPEALADIVADYNSDKARLHRLIEHQFYRLAFWRVGPHELNYRRFFDVTDLVGVRVEDEAVFKKTHEFIFDLVSRKAVTGLRVDHPDGLRDPKTYFDRLQSRGPVYVVGEKILSDGEKLPSDWKVQGTTGYDFLNYMNGIFVDSANKSAFSKIYEEFTGCTESFEAVAFESKKYVLKRLFISEVDALTRRLKQIASQNIEGVDFSWRELRAAIIEFVAAFPVYRSYLRQDRAHPDEVEMRYINETIKTASGRKPQLGSALEFLGKVLRVDSELKPALEFIFKFQQLTGPATAKGLEDTAFYRSTRFISLNEVGGNPGEFGVSVEEFHAWNQYKASNWPHSLLATATHDTKRGEDVRARLNVLSELPGEWRERVMQWKKINLPLKTQAEVPSLCDEYLLYQTLVGTWPSTERNGKEYIERIQSYLVKAAREAKIHTSWTDPDAGYEESLKSFAAQVLASEQFLAAFEPFQNRIASTAVVNSLAQIVLKSFSPGVPDFYQGTELWDFSLVDPDNRRSVDYNVRKQSLGNTTKAAELLREAETGTVKMWLITKALQFRRANSDFFASAKYEALPATGGHADRICAFKRRLAEKEVVVVVPRLSAGIGSRWEDTGIPINGIFHNLITSEEVKSGEIQQIFRTFPVAVLEKIDP